MTKRIYDKTDAITCILQKHFGVPCFKEYKFHKKRLWRFDYAIPAYNIAIEVEGGIWIEGRHIRPKGFLNDIEKYNEATVLGWKVLRCVPSDILSVMDLIQRIIDSMQDCEQKG